MDNLKKFRIVVTMACISSNRVCTRVQEFIYKNVYQQNKRNLSALVATKKNIGFSASNHHNHNKGFLSSLDSNNTLIRKVLNKHQVSENIYLKYNKFHKIMQ